MWALPTMKQLNQEAETKRFQSKLKRALKTGKMDGKTLKCEWWDHDTSHCSGELYRYLHYDIFSDAAKGILTLCEHHDGYYGSPTEGYFTCADCERVMIENITWERYEHTTDDGETICTKCYAARVLNDDERWVPLTDEAIDALTFADLKKAPHCLAVQMPLPVGIEFVVNTEFDSGSGQVISGHGVDEIKEALHELKEQKCKRAIIILDGAYQFAVSLAVYKPVEGGPFDK